MSFTYSKRIGDIKVFFESAKIIARTTGARFSGDENKGKFSGDTILGEISGSYLVNDNVMKITIHEKPFLVPESKIRTTLDKFFS
jgi:hypothetical protein